MEDSPLSVLMRFAQKNLILVALCIGGALLIVVAGIFLSSPTEDDVVILQTQQLKPSPVKTVLSATTEMVVDIEGAVLKPGVYSLKPNSRVRDVLDMAGGFSNDADQQRITKDLNLAQKITDGIKIYIPFKGEEVAALYSSDSILSAGGSAQSGLTNLNTASESELESLPRIGEVTAKKIIENRPYQTVSDLIQKKVLGAATFSAIEDRITAP